LIILTQSVKESTRSSKINGFKPSKVRAMGNLLCNNIAPSPLEPELNFCKIASLQTKGTKLVKRMPMA
jgi:hypothetical protein